MTIFRCSLLAATITIGACGAPETVPVAEDADDYSFSEDELDRAASTSPPTLFPDPAFDLQMEQGKVQARQYEEYRESLDRTVHENKARELERRVDQLERQQQMDDVEEIFER